MVRKIRHIRYIRKVRYIKFFHGTIFTFFFIAYFLSLIFYRLFLRLFLLLFLSLVFIACFFGFLFPFPIQAHRHHTNICCRQPFLLSRSQPSVNLLRKDSKHFFLNLIISKQQGEEILVLV